MGSPVARLGFLAMVLVVLGAAGCGRAKTEDAYVTLLYGDEFLLGVRVLGKSIRDTGSTKDMVVLVSDGVSDYAMKLLHADGWIVEHISLLANPNHVRPTRFWGVYTKLKIFNMTNYRKVVYLDADTIVIKSIEDLFKCGKFCANLKHSERLNSGVMVVEPSESTFKDMMSQVNSLYSYTGGDQGFLNSYYSDFPNAHVFEPDLSSDAKNSIPVPEMQRLSTLYNADVGLYMLANKVDFRKLEINYAHTDGARARRAPSASCVDQAVRFNEASLGRLPEPRCRALRWMVDEKELRVIHYTLGPLKPWDWWTAWLLKPVDVWQNVRKQLGDSLPGTGGGRNPNDQLLVKFLFAFPVILLIFCYYRSFLQINKDFTTIFSRSSLCDYARRIYYRYRSGGIPAYSGVGVASSSFVNSSQQFSTGAHSKLPAHLGAISIFICFVAAALSLGLSFILVPHQVMPWTGLLLMYEWTFVTFFIMFGSYLNFIYQWGKSTGNQTNHNRFDSSDYDSGKGSQRGSSSCDIVAWFYWLGMAFLAVIVPSMPCFLGITALFARRDLRIEDNPALSAAAKDGCVLPVFIWCPSEEGQFYPGRVSRWWMKHSLAHLDRSLRSLGTPLTFIRSESTLAALLQCIGAIRATRLVYNHLYDPVSLVRDHKIKSQLVSLGISVQSFNGDLLYEPWEVYDESGLAFTTFDAYWGKCRSMPNELTMLLPPWKLVPPTGTESVESCSIEEFGLENEIEKSSNALLSRAWSPGWSNADKVLSEFIDEHLLEYSNNRMKVEGTTTSLLSPYLHFGELSVRKIYQNVRMKQIQWAKEGNCKAEESVNFFLRSIGLREYSRYLCFNFPFTYERSLLGNLKHYPWRADEGQFKSWRQGRTGYPLVDAGMRELWATGWIHNRTRVIVASFFVKILLLPWTWGMKYFWDTLLDADLESDILGWQYVSGSLPDGHDLKRLDSPEVLGQKYDPDGEYIRNWIPELARLPTEWIHHPWDAPSTVLKAAGVELGLNYPRPIVEILTARERLNDAVDVMWELDRAAKIAKLSSSGEVVADNLISLNNLDIPKVVVKKEISCTSSSLDQRVPSIHNMKDISVNKKPRDPIGEKPCAVILSSHSDTVDKSKMDVDLLSTAESSSARKRSIGESHCAVPTHFSSSPDINPVQEDCSMGQCHLNRSSSDYPWQGADGIGEGKVASN
ncbi:hypothetical protein C4D60_Mb05t20350 [Musa balbisiana]|uniref:Photolyase/cryptochrome alpha/beta domain-containing protein n=1 Tax=Musa balbisiana TaxID=52838 RepID=A0A4S8JXK5_MUSBA|nr:hypothetical protein C4D60_Mb05t20350 [Musa balbisiana]